MWNTHDVSYKNKYLKSPCFNNDRDYVYLCCFLVYQIHCGFYSKNIRINQFKTSWFFN